MSNQTAEQIAEKIRNAEASGALIAPVKDDFSEATVDAATPVASRSVHDDQWSDGVSSGLNLGQIEALVENCAGRCHDHRGMIR